MSLRELISIELLPFGLSLYSRSMIILHHLTLKGRISPLSLEGLVILLQYCLDPRYLSHSH
jgi:hypothetical protein